MSTLEQTSEREAPKHAGLTLPAWLDGRTVALLTTVVTATLTLGAMMQTAHSRLASDIDQVRDELRTDMAKLDDRLRSVEINVAAIRMATTGLDARVRTVEELVRRPVSPPPAG